MESEESRGVSEVEKSEAPPIAKDSKHDFLKKRGRDIFGLICLFGVIILWVGSSELIQFIFENQSFSKPLFTTYLNTSFFTIYLLRVPIEMLIKRFRGRKNNQKEADFHLLGEERQADEKEPVERLSLFETAKLSLYFCPLWFLDAYTFNLSLVMTSVSSNTILSSTSALWTLILSTILRVEEFNIIKLGGVALSFGGVVMVSLTDSRSSGTESIWGDLLAIFSAITYAFYVTLFKKAVKNEERVKNDLFLGFLGLFNMLTMWPLFAIWDVFGWESFSFPSLEVFGFLALNGIAGTVLSDYLWLLSILMLSPVISTVGLSLSIPVAMFTDMIIKGSSYAPLYIIGALLVALGFVVVNVAGQIKDKCINKK